VTLYGMGILHSHMTLSVQETPLANSPCIRMK